MSGDGDPASGTGAGFAADPAALVTRAGQLDDLVGRVGEIHRALAEDLTATGPCWGGDAVGRSFAAAHTGPADDTLTRLSSLTERLGGVGDRFTATATTYTGTDEGVVERLRVADQDV